MSKITRPLRSVLYIPGSKDRALDKARGLPADAIIFDLEDAVIPEEKTAARETLATALKDGGYGSRYKVIRINGLDTEWGADDARAAAKMDCDAILLPKVGSPADLDALAEITGDIPLWAMMETPGAMLNAAAIGAHPKLQCMVMGTNDLVKELYAEHVPGRAPLLTSLSMALLAARAAGVQILDGVYNDVKDAEGFLAECEQGRQMGFDGKTLIHPGQVEPANEQFAPSAEAVEDAKGLIEAFETAGSGVATYKNKMIENLHVESARRTLTIHEAISALG